VSIARYAIIWIDSRASAFVSVTGIATTNLIRFREIHRDLGLERCGPGCVRGRRLRRAAVSAMAKPGARQAGNGLEDDKAMKGPN
jgi:hypothetical protein